jgi:hypothetical protein
LSTIVSLDHQDCSKLIDARAAGAQSKQCDRDADAIRMTAVTASLSIGEDEQRKY